MSFEQFFYLPLPSPPLTTTHSVPTSHPSRYGTVNTSCRCNEPISNQSPEDESHEMLDTATDYHLSIEQLPLTTIIQFRLEHL